MKKRRTIQKTEHKDRQEWRLLSGNALVLGFSCSVGHVVPRFFFRTKYRIARVCLVHRILLQEAASAPVVWDFCGMASLLEVQRQFLPLKKELQAPTAVLVEPQPPQPLVLLPTRRVQNMLGIHSYSPKSFISHLQTLNYLYSLCFARTAPFLKSSM